MLAPMRRGLPALAAALLVATLAADPAAAPFAAVTVLAPGETMVLDPGGSRADGTRLERHAGRGSFVPADGKGVVSLRTTVDIVTDCTSWGDASCP